MNVHNPDTQWEPTRDDAAHALQMLRAWTRTASQDEIDRLDPALARLVSDGVDYPVLARAYPEDFEAGPAYRASLPDLQNGVRGPRRQGGGDPKGDGASLRRRDLRLQHLDAANHLAR